MARPYSDDLRCRLLEAWEAGEGSLRDLAEQFRVSWGYSKKIRAQQLQSGQKQRPVQGRHGPLSCLTEAVREQLRAWLQEQSDLTELELRDRLAGVGVRVCKSRVGQVLREMGLRRKKNHSTRKSAIVRSISNGAPSSRKRLAGSRRSG